MANPISFEEFKKIHDSCMKEYEHNFHSRGGGYKFKYLDLELFYERLNLAPEKQLPIIAHPNVCNEES
jgi:hypothetical protein